MVSTLEAMEASDATYSQIRSIQGPRAPQMARLLDHAGKAVSSMQHLDTTSVSTHVGRKVRMLERLVDGESLLGVECECLLEEVKGLGRGVGEDGAEGAALADG